MDGFIDSSYEEGNCDTAYAYNIKATDICLDITGLYSTDAASFIGHCQGNGNTSSAITINRYQDNNCTKPEKTYQEESFQCEIRGSYIYII